MSQVLLDMAEVDLFAAELGGVPQSLARHAIPVLKRYAQDVKEAQQADFRSSSNAGIRKVGNAVRYDAVSAGSDGYETEVGVDKGRPGSLANIAVFGTWKGGGTHKHPSFHAMQSYDLFAKALEDVATEILS